MSTTQSKHKIKHTWNQFGKIGLKFENGDTREIENPWYFAVLKTDADKAKEMLKGSLTEFKINPKFPDFVKIYVPLDRDGRALIVMKLEDAGIETYEGDLMPDRRFYIDSEIEIAQTYNKLYFDIETDDTIPRIEIGRDRILSFAAIDSDGKIFFEELKSMTDEDEKVLLIKILKIIRQYDLILGWNSSGFDVPYLKERMKRYDISRMDIYCWKEVGHFDLLKRFRHIFRFDNHIKSFSLNNIANHFIKESKVDRTERTIDLWKNNKKKLKEYNIQDSVLVKKLDEELGVSDMMIRQSSWCGVPVGQFGLYSIIDAYIMRCAHRSGKYVKTSVRAIQERSKDNVRGRIDPSHGLDDEAKYSGAIVLEPLIGKYDDVHTFDFKGLYPSLMRTSNIGYDTIRYEAEDNCIINPGTAGINRMVGELKPTYFIKDLSVINIAITELITKRSEYKKLKLKMIEEGKDRGSKWERVVSDEIIVKELANSTYGIMGLQYGRYFSVDVAESITLFGQWCINYAKAFFEKEGYKVIYGDTDSVFVATTGEFNPSEALKKFHVQIKEDLKFYNIGDSFIQLEYDKQYKGLILTAKKNYAGRAISIEGKKTDQVYIRGLDCIKKSTFSYASEKQRELINKIIYENISKEDCKKWCDQTKKEFFEREFTTQELEITNKIGKPLNEYKSKSLLHIRLAQEILDRTGEFAVNSEVEYIITKSSGKTLDGVLSINYTGNFDRNYYWENKTLPVIERITSVVYPGSDFFSNQLKLF